MTQSQSHLKIRFYDSATGTVQFSESKLTTYFNSLEKELATRTDADSRTALLFEALHEYREAAREFPADSHLEVTNLLIDCLKTFQMDPLVGSLVQPPFFMLENIPVRSPDKVKLYLRSGIGMTEIIGNTQLKLINRKREVGLKVLIRVRDCPQTPIRLREIASGAIGRDYYAPDVGIALETIREALKEALKILEGLNCSYLP